MKNIRYFLTAISFIALLALTAFAQEQMYNVSANDTPRGYVLGPGDVLSIKVLGDSQFDAETVIIDDDGMIQLPFIDNPIQAQCRTEREMRVEVTKALGKYLKSPQVTVTAKERKSRPAATVSGAIQAPQLVEMRRQVRLWELISFAGGPTEDAGSVVQLYRTRPPMCASQSEIDEFNQMTANGNDVPPRFYSINSLKKGLVEANPVIYPGDVIYIPVASPVYITGMVLAPQGVRLKEGGLSLTRAIGMVGGLQREASKKDVFIRRLKPGTQEYAEPMVVNYELISKGQQKDIMLEPYDIIEVGKTKKSTTQIILETIIGVGKTAATGFSQVLPQRVLY